MTRAPLLLLLAAAGVAAAGCDLEPAPRGPSGGRVTFDAAMLDPVPSAPRDGGVRDTGVDTGVEPEPRCQGVPRLCLARLTRAGCVAGGCDWIEECGGVAASCRDHDSRACRDHEGCRWNHGGAGSCQGTPYRCAYHRSAGTCGRHRGCRWEGSCGGVPTRCDDLEGEASCAEQPGCEWR